MAIRSVLVVDDDPGIRQLIAKILNREGYLVGLASGAIEALRELDRQAFDLVLTDLIMPEGDGFELITALQKSHPSVRVVAMSGGGRVGAGTYLSIARGFRVNGLLPKPFVREQLLTVLRKSGEDEGSEGSAPAAS